MSNRASILVVIPITIAAVMMVALSGCAPAPPKHIVIITVHPGGTTKTPSASATKKAIPTLAPKPIGPAPLPANALLRITATVTAPGGAAADLAQTVYLPTPITSAQKAQLDTDCADSWDPNETNAPWLNNFAGADILTSTMTATLHSGSPAWDNTNNPVLSDFWASGDFSGAYNTFQAYCSPGFISIPGTEQAISPIQSVNPSGQNWGWAGEFGSYGFYGGGNDPENQDELGGGAVVANCAIQLSSTAAASSVAAAWAAAAPGYKLSDGCDFEGPQAP
jgi:hypothetical protein